MVWQENGTCGIQAWMPCERLSGRMTDRSLSQGNLLLMWPWRFTFCSFGLFLNHRHDYSSLCCSLWKIIPLSMEKICFQIFFSSPPRRMTKRVCETDVSYSFLFKVLTKYSCIVKERAFPSSILFCWKSPPLLFFSPTWGNKLKIPCLSISCELSKDNFSFYSCVVV